MIAYKGFTKDLTARMGRGIYNYQIGRTETNSESNCGRNGFHCTEEPIEVLGWYNSPNDRYCIVKAGGDIHEDGTGRISCSELTPIKEITRIQLAAHECDFLMRHPDREYNNRVFREKGTSTKDGFVIVRGKHPIAKGNKGDILFLLEEEKKSRSIKNIMVLQVDGKEVIPNKFYGVDGKEIADAKK